MAKQSDAEITRDVIEELLWDPAVTIADLGVAVDHGKVTLTGTAATFTTKWEAEDAAYRVQGVNSVTNSVVVDATALGLRRDVDILEDIRTALAIDITVPNGRIAIDVKNGFVTLSGDVDWFYQRENAEEDAGMIRGVTGVDDQILVLQPTVSATDISNDIARAFARNAELFDDNVVVLATADGNVTLTGTVETWSERDMAEDIAWRSRGVTNVNDEILVGALVDLLRAARTEREYDGTMKRPTP